MKTENKRNLFLTKEIDRLNKQLEIKDQIISYKQEYLDKILNGKIWRILQVYFDTRDNLKKIKNFRKIPKKVIGKLYEFYNLRKDSKIIKTIFDNNISKTSIIALPTIDWNTPLYQRPQHLAIQLAKKNLLYFYSTCNYKHDKLYGTKRKFKNLYITNRWDLVIKQAPNSYIFLLSTQQLTTINDIKKYKQNGNQIIYDYVDEIHEEISGSKIMADFLQNRHNYIKESKIADLVLCVSNRLYQEMLMCYPKDRVLLVQNGVEYNHFQLKKDLNKVPKDLKKIVKSKKPIIGYYGALAKWIDYDLINNTAIKHPDWNFVFIGVDYDKSLSSLKKIDNIFFLGSKTYQELPKYAIWFDVTTIPFVRGEIAKSTSPLKFYEYMAMGKPTVITEDLDDCKDYKGVFISKNNPEDFSNQIQKALDVRHNKTYIANCKKIAKNNTWEKKSKMILKKIN